jgi:hypothetical protein
MLDSIEIQGPSDPMNLLYWVFLLFGSGTLLAWNAVLNAFGFFANRVI